MSEPTIVKACRNADVGALRRELAAGVSPNTREYGVGFTLLQRIAVAGYVEGDERERNDRAEAEMISILLSAGADVNAKINPDVENLTALHIAVNSAKLKIIPLLIAAGASLTAESNPTEEDPGEIPIESVNAAGRRVLSLLLRAGSPLPRPGHGWLQQPSTLAGPFRSTVVLMLRYIDKVRAAGGLPAYERAHRTRLTKTFAPVFPALPEEVVSKVVSFYAHVGDY